MKNKKIFKDKICECGYNGKFFGKKCGVCRQKKWVEARKKKYKSTGELDLFQKMWDKIPHRSFVNGQSIFYFSVTHFSHVLPKAKGKYPQFKLYEKNIVLMTPEQHTTWEYYKYTIINDPTWKHVFELEEQLKKEYAEGTGKI